MTIALPTTVVRDGNFLPDDLSLYIGKKTLVKLILEVTEDLNVRSSGRQDIETGNPNIRPAMMVTLLAYCYASGIYGSTDIQLSIQHDQMIRYLCARNYPDLCAIRSFRRYHRERISRCLTAVLGRVWELRFRGEDAVPIGSGSGSVSRWIGQTATPDFRREAEQRITRAVRADSMAMDV